MQVIFFVFRFLGRDTGEFRIGATFISPNLMIHAIEQNSGDSHAV
jgi:hypothetical protein